MASPQASVDPTAVFGRRVGAALIDGLLILVPAFLLLTAGFEYLDVGALDRDPQEFCDQYTSEMSGFCLNLADVNDRVYFSDGASGVSTAWYWGATFVLLVIVQGLTGRTVGKAITGIRTVQEDGSPPGLMKALVRWLLWAVDAFPYVVPLLGSILALTTQGHRRIGDMVAKTFVVRASAAGAPIVVPGMAGPEPPLTTSMAPGAWGAPSTTGPQWDAARNTYIQWDETRRLWLQWDSAASTWSPIDGQ